MFNKILFPTDNSDNSKKVVGFVIEMAKKFQSEVIIFHSYEFPVVISGHPAEPTSYYNDEIKKEITEAGNKMLNNIKALFEKEKIPVKTILEKGEAAPLITRVIDTENCELVIMGSRGLSETKSFLIGSVSNYVIHHSKKPVMVIN